MSQCTIGAEWFSLVVAWMLGSAAGAD